MQNLKLILLIFALSSLLMFVGNAIAGESGLVLALGIGLATQGIAFWNSDKIALAMNSARELPENENPDLHAMVRYLSERAGIPSPRLFITPDSSPNAFATGRDPEHSAVAVTQGLLRALNRDQLEGVIAHELGHIKNRDVFLSTIAAVLAASISSLTQFAFMFGGHRDDDGDGGSPIVAIAAIILAPIAASLIQFAISRTREYEADATAVQITGNPIGLASALEQIHAQIERRQTAPESLQPAYASLYIANPFTGKSFMQLFSTHPPVEKRIEAILKKGRAISE